VAEAVIGDHERRAGGNLRYATNRADFEDAPASTRLVDLDGAAVVEVTSQEKEYPVDSALISGEMRG